MITVVTWQWGSKYEDKYVRRLAASVRRNLKQEHRFICLTDGPSAESVIDAHSLRAPIVDRGLLDVPGCFARLRMFDPEWQHIIGMGEGDRLVCIDLDTVITGPLDPLFDRDEPFVIMQDGNASNPCRFNGALMMIRFGAHPEVFSDFSLEAARAAPYYEFPDDQGWIWHKVPQSAGWKCGVRSGVFVFHKPGWPGWNKKIKQDFLPSTAKVVTFSGWRTPHRFSHLPWVKKHWNAEEP